MNTEFWKERGKKPKIGIKYQAEVPDLIHIKAEKDSPDDHHQVYFQDAPIPIEYFELQHFYSWYRGQSFGVDQYVAQQRAAAKEREKQKQRELAKFESQFRRCARFKSQNTNYREQSPPPLPRDTSSSSDEDLFLDSSSDPGDRTSDEEYVAPGYVPQTNGHKKGRSTRTTGRSTRTKPSSKSTSGSQRGRSTKSKSNSKSKSKSKSKTKSKDKDKSKSKKKKKSNGSTKKHKVSGHHTQHTHQSNGSYSRKRTMHDVIDLSAECMDTLNRDYRGIPALLPQPFSKRSKFEHTQRTSSPQTIQYQVPIPPIPALSPVKHYPSSVVKMQPQIKGIKASPHHGSNGIGSNGVGDNGFGNYGENQWDAEIQKNVIVLDDSD